MPAGTRQQKMGHLGRLFHYLKEHIAPSVMNQVKSDVYRHGWTYVFKAGLLPPVFLTAMHDYGVTGSAAEMVEYARCELLGWCNPKDRAKTAKAKRANPSSTMGDGPKPSHYRKVPRGKKRDNRVEKKKKPRRTKASTRAPRSTFRLTNPGQRRAAVTSSAARGLWGAKLSQVQTTAPVSISELKTSVKPKFSMSSDGTKITVSRTEYVDDIKAESTGYELSTFVLTPTNTTLFPWLSGIAARYESYSFNGVSIHYCPTAPTSTPGMVGMAAEFDAADDDPIDKHQFLNITPADRASVWAGQSIHLTKRDLNILTGENGTRFCGEPLTNAVLKTMTQDGDAHTTLAGRVFLMMQDVTGAIAGEIWVEYSVTLSIPDYAPPCNVPAPLLYTWAGTTPSWYYELFSDESLLQAMPGVAHVSGGNNNVLTFKYPDKRYRLTINTAGPSGTFLNGSHSTPIIINTDGGIIIDQTVTGSRTYKTNNTQPNSTQGVVSVYIYTAKLEDGGPTPAAPGTATILLNGVLISTQTITLMSTRLQELTEVEWDNRAIQPFGESKTCRAPPPSDDDWDAVSETPTPGSEPPETSGWIRASRVLGYAGTTTA
jgi:hypothetical protein